MSNRVDMSLDEIIKQDRIAVGKPNRFKSTNRNGVQRKRKGSEIRKIAAVSRTMKQTRFSKKNPTKALSNQYQVSSNHSSSNVSSSTLLISNLHPQVSDSDICELFSECGPLKSCSINYDSTGRSLCTAQVVFSKVSDANFAIQKYNQVPLDGRPMNIQPLITTPHVKNMNISQRLGNMAQRVFKSKPKSKLTNSKFSSKRVSGSNLSKNKST